MKRFLVVLLLIPILGTPTARARQRPNVILIFADDISARELPIYGSSVWSPPTGGDTSADQYRARTPVLDRLATEGCWIKTAWASVVCSPSRAMIMTGRYAHRHKWWHNTVLIFCADNGTSGYGKNSADRQKGTHVPLMIYAPQLAKRGAQDILVNMSDMLPTLAELVGASLPDDYEINGKSLGTRSRLQD